MGSRLKKASILVLLTLAIGLYFSYPLGAEEGGEDRSRVEYDLGMNLSMEGKVQEAMAHYRLALQGEGDMADSSRIQLVRNLARTGAPLPEVRALLQAIEDPVIQGRAYLNAVAEYAGSSHLEPGVELAIEYARQNADSAFADDALFLAALMEFRMKHYRVSRSILMEIVQLGDRSDMIDDAYYFLACIYFVPGDTYNPSMALAILHKFQRNLDKPWFRDSLWRESVVRLLMRYG